MVNETIAVNTAIKCAVNRDRKQCNNTAKYDLVEWVNNGYLPIAFAVTLW
jgi:hypothetical protein